MAAMIEDTVRDKVKFGCQPMRRGERERDGLVGAPLLALRCGWPARRQGPVPCTRCRFV